MESRLTLIVVYAVARLLSAFDAAHAFLSASYQKESGR